MNTTMQIAYALKIVEDLAEKRNILFVEQIKSIETYPQYYSPKARVAIKTIKAYNEEMENNDGVSDAEYFAQYDYECNPD